MDQRVTPRPAPLKRSMRVIGVLLLTLSAVTPASSVFVGVPTVISEAGTGTLVSMLIGALLAVPITCVYAELSSAFPIAGGEYALVGRTLGPAPGFAILGLTVAVNMLAPAVLALGVAENLAPGSRRRPTPGRPRRSSPRPPFWPCCTSAPTPG
jgi:amino acid transporter